MPNIRVHKPNGMLFIDFRYKGLRCREYTALADTLANRRKLQQLCEKIEKDIKANAFDYGQYFPNSKTIERLRIAEQQL